MSAPASRRVAPSCVGRRRRVTAHAVESLERRALLATTVPATADLWLAGMPSGTTLNGDTVPTNAPPSVAVTPGQQLTFATTGLVSFSGGPSTTGGTDGPEGQTGYIVVPNGSAQNGISTGNMPVDSLIGVFLGASAPNTSAAPANRDFNSAALRDFTTLSPLLKQSFFIGDGKTTGGTVQKFVVPSGATRLFLGTVDGSGWYNNAGQFSTTIGGLTASGASIAGTVYWDSNKNGTMDGDVGLAGATVWLDSDNDSVIDSTEKQLTTASDGKFSFTGLAAGTFHVRVKPPANYGPTNPTDNHRQVTLTTGQASASNLFGEAKLTGTAVVSGNNLTIAAGDTTPTTTDFTDFGSAAVGGTTVVRTFTLTNTGKGTLTLNASTPIALSGVDAASFRVVLKPATTLAAGAKTIFQVEFAPSLSGARNATVTVNSDDPARAAYAFAVKGNATGFGYAFGLGSTGDDEGRSIVSDAAGNTYVGGNFVGTVDFDPGSGTTTFAGPPAVRYSGKHAGFVAKYSPTGALLWARAVVGTSSDGTKFGGVNDLAIDASGNVYGAATFKGKGTLDGATVDTANALAGLAFKFNASGALQWYRLLGTGGVAEANGVGVDSSGNAYVGGIFRGKTMFNGTAFTSVGFTGGTANGNTLSDAFLAKIGPTGTFAWTKAFGSKDVDVIERVAVNAGGTVALQGFFQGTADFDPGTGVKTMTAVTNSAGQPYNDFISVFKSDGTWSAAKGLGASTYADDVAIDASANVYLSGFAAAGLVAKYSPTLTTVWQTTLSPGTTGMVYGRTLALASNGSIYVGGDFSKSVTLDVVRTATGLTDGVIFRLDAAGKVNWSRQLVGTSDWDEVEGLALDRAGNVFATGYFGFLTTHAGTSADFDPGAGTYNVASKGNTDTVMSDAFVWRLNAPAQPAIRLEGTGAALIPNGSAVSSSTGQDFGSVARGATKTVKFAIHNTGTAALTLSKFTLAGTNPGDFLLANLPLVVAAGATVQFDFIFKPTATGARSAVLTILSGDPLTPSYAFSVKGTGV